MAFQLKQNEKQRKIKKISTYDKADTDHYIKMRVLFVCLCQQFALALTDNQDGRPEGQSDPGV